jgi:hypothetical protein
MARRCSSLSRFRIRLLAGVFALTLPFTADAADAVAKQHPAPVPNARMSTRPPLPPTRTPAKVRPFQRPNIVGKKSVKKNAKKNAKKKDARKKPTQNAKRRLPLKKKSAKKSLVKERQKPDSRRAPPKPAVVRRLPPVRAAPAPLAPSPTPPAVASAPKAEATATAYSASPDSIPPPTTPSRILPFHPSSSRKRESDRRIKLDFTKRY